MPCVQAAVEDAFQVSAHLVRGGERPALCRHRLQQVTDVAWPNVGHGQIADPRLEVLLDAAADDAGCSQRPESFECSMANRQPGGWFLSFPKKRMVQRLYEAMRPGSTRSH